MFIGILRILAWVAFVHAEIEKMIQSLEPIPDVLANPRPIGYNKKLANRIEMIKWSLANPFEEREPGFEKLRVFPSRY